MSRADRWRARQTGHRDSRASAVLPAQKKSSVRVHVMQGARHATLVGDPGLRLIRGARTTDAVTGRAQDLIL